MKIRPERRQELLELFSAYAALPADERAAYKQQLEQRAEQLRTAAAARPIEPPREIFVRRS